MSKKENFNIKNKKIQKIKLKSGEEFSYIIDKNQVQQTVKETKLKLQKWKKWEMFYRTLNIALEFVVFIMLGFCVAGWIVVDFSYWWKISLGLLVLIFVFIKWTFILNPIVESVGYNNYRYALDDIVLFGDLQSREFINISVIKNDINPEKFVDLKFSFLDKEEEKEKIIKKFEIIKTDNIKVPIVVFSRKEYYVPNT